jgi:mannose-6-phosphate isomerase-like protein (cupin superfamily)
MDAVDQEVGMETRTEGIAIPPGEGERVPRGERYHRVLCELPALEVFELRFGPEFEGVEPHTHPDHADCFFVLEGEAEFTLNGELMRAGPGTFVAAPIGAVHGFRNAGDGELRVLNMHAPNTGFGLRLRAG